MIYHLAFEQFEIWSAAAERSGGRHFGFGQTICPSHIPSAVKAGALQIGASEK
jgi:hypothetical protein